MTSRKLVGIAASPGIVFGKAFLFSTSSYKIPVYSLALSEIEKEVQRFEVAVEKSKEQIKTIRDKIEKELDEVHSSIFDSHILMLDDPLLYHKTIERIRKERKNAESVFNDNLEKIIRVFRSIQDEYLRDRDSDIKDIGNRVLDNLAKDSYCRISPLTTLQEEVIVVARDLAPSDTANMSKEKVIGFVTDIGSQTSHTAIMSKALEIPAVVGLDFITEHVNTGDLLIVDGIRGVVYVNPRKEIIEKYTKEKEEYRLLEKSLEKLSGLPAETLDGYTVELSANVELPEEVDHVISHGADGIGLFRTEFLYLRKDKLLPTEEEQYEVYSQMVKKVHPTSVIFRTLDLGGDKFSSSLNLSRELNPFLGLRAIRLCLEHPQIFKTQLRALLRASVHGNLKIMFPMISGIEEVRAAKKFLKDVQKDLQDEGIEFDKNIEVGIMIEIPSAAITADILAKESSFFSLGTNDLIQYTIAVDRVNEKVAYLYEPLHPAIIRLIKMVVDAAHTEGKWVGICGEMASDPVFAIILIGLGLDELSMSALTIPEIKKIIRNIRLSDAKEVVEEIFTKTNAKDIRNTVQRRFKHILSQIRMPI